MGDVPTKHSRPECIDCARTYCSKQYLNGCGGKDKQSLIPGIMADIERKNLWRSNDNKQNRGEEPE